MRNAQSLLIDTHCHLDAAEFADDRDAVFDAARAAGVSRIIIPAVELANFAAVRDCCQRYPGCVPAYGIHPLYVDRAGDEDLDTLRAWLQNESLGAHPPVAVGEIGLDYFVSGFDAARQSRFFTEQLKIARALRLPVLLHARHALDAVLAHLRRFQLAAGIVHAFNGSRQQADAFIALGFKLGFGGAATWERARRIRAMASTLPLESIVLETDAPDMPPEFAAHSRNTPEHLPRIAALIAELRGIPTDDLCSACSFNAQSILDVFRGSA